MRTAWKSLRSVATGGQHLISQPNTLTPTTHPNELGIDHSHNHCLACCGSSPEVFVPLLDRLDLDRARHGEARGSGGKVGAGARQKGDERLMDQRECVHQGLVVSAAVWLVRLNQPA